MYDDEMKTNKKVSFATFSQAQSALKAADGPCMAISVNTCTYSIPKQEVENTMSTERNHLINRIDNIYYVKTRDLQGQFHIGEYTGPRHYKELIDWIKHGKFELDAKRTKVIDRRVEENDEYMYDHDCFDGITWTGRGHKNDFENYSKACDELKKAYNKAIDTAKVLEPAEGLKALNKFEEWSYKS